MSSLRYVLLFLCMSLFRKQSISLPLNIFKVMTHLQQTYLSLISLNKISPKLSVSRDLNVFEFNLRKFQEWQELALLTETEWDPEPLWMPKELDPCPVAVREHKPPPIFACAFGGMLLATLSRGCCGSTAVAAVQYFFPDFLWFAY